jgi:hypothetical protein
MASQHVLEARRVKAIQDQAVQLTEINARLARIEAHLGIQEAAVASEPVLSMPTEEPEGEPEKKKPLKSGGSK